MNAIESLKAYDRWPQLSIEAKRTIAEQITDIITIGGDEIHIKFSYNPSLLGIKPDSQHNLRGSGYLLNDDSNIKIY
jgi:hypothetical protein